MAQIHFANKDYELEEVISKTVMKTLLNLGLDVSDPIEMQKDFAHLRAWREATLDVKKKGALTLLGLIITGAAGLFWASFRNSLH